MFVKFILHHDRLACRVRYNNIIIILFSIIIILNHVVGETLSFYPLDTAPIAYYDITYAVLLFENIIHEAIQIS